MTFPDTTFTTGTTITSEWLNAVNDKCTAVYNVLDYGALGNGVQDDSAAIQSCIDAILAAGGGTMFVPKGTYKLDTGLVGGSNLHIQCEAGVTFDGSSMTTGNQTLLTYAGTAGDQINLAVNAERGDTQLTTATAHGLVAGDWIFLMSQRVCLHPDAGDWQLGTPTGYSWRANNATIAGDQRTTTQPNGIYYVAQNNGTTGSTEPTWPTTLGNSVVDGTVVWVATSYMSSVPYFAEPIQVKSIVDNYTFTLQTPILFPSYRINRDEETYISTRVSTIRKMNFCVGAKVSGNPTFIARGLVDTGFGVGVKFLYCKEPEIEATFDLGDLPSAGMYFIRTMNGSAKVRAFRPVNWIKGSFSHASFNSYKDLMSWWCSWDVEDTYGSQGLDVTYGGVTDGFGYSTSIGPKITGKSFSPKETGMTFHAGCYGAIVDNFYAYNCPTSGIFCRSRFVNITNFYAFSSSTQGRGIILGGWATDCVVSNFNINGMQYGISIDKDTELGVAGPAWRNIEITGGIITNCYSGIRFVVSEDIGGVTADPCGVHVSNVRFYNSTLTHIQIDKYWNSVRITNCSFGPLENTGRQAVIVNQNAVKCIVNNCSFLNLGSTNDGINAGYTISDTTTFPPSEYPYALHKIDANTLFVSGPIDEVYNTPTVGYYRPTTNFTLPSWCAGETIMCYSSSTITVTVPADDVNIPIGAEVTLVQESTGVITLAAATGITIIKTGSSTNGVGKFVTLKKLQYNRWVAYGNLV